MAELVVAIEFRLRYAQHAAPAKWPQNIVCERTAGVVDVVVAQPRQTEHGRQEADERSQY